MKDKFGIFFSLFILLASNSLQASELTKADSLFMEKKYTEAFSTYETIYQNGQASPAMLMRMAYIQEALGNYTSAIIYLSHYLEMTGDRDALEQIRTIADENELYGYAYTDTGYLLSLLKKYRTPVLGIMASLIILMIALVYRGKRKNQSMLGAFVFQCLFVILFFIISVGLFNQRKAIITSDKSILMSGPSAAAEPVEVVKKGHKVQVFDEKGIWVGIVWDNQRVYIRKSKVTII